MTTMGETVPAREFGLLPETPIHWGTLCVSFLAQTLLVVLAARINISLMAPVLYPVDTTERVHLVAPVFEPVKREPEKVAAVRKPPAPKPIVPPKIRAKVAEPTPPPIEVPKVEMAKVTPPSLPQAAKTDTLRKPDFEPSGSSAPVTVHKPARQVQTGGFGDLNGVPPNPNATSKGPVIAQVGGFDLPQGPGNGNGTGGSKGVRGTVASVGFGNSVAGPGGGGYGGSKGGGTVQTANFGSVGPAPAEAPKRQVASGSAKDTPVSLLSKPTPSYTTEARQKKIEGDVELEVEFTASGHVHVIRVLHRLGYGLDESAVRAAERIQFAPARRDGQAVDAEGLLKIVFRLS